MTIHVYCIYYIVSQILNNNINIQFSGFFVVEKVGMVALHKYINFENRLNSQGRF